MLCEKLQKAGYTPFFIPGRDNWTVEMIPIMAADNFFASHPGLIEQITSNKIKPSQSPEFCDLVERVLALEKYVNSDFRSSPYSDGLDPLVNGKCAMYPMAGFIWDGFVPKYGEAKFKGLGMMPITLYDNSISVSGGVDVISWCVPKSCKDVKGLKALSTLCFNQSMKPFTLESELVRIQTSK